MTLRRLDLDEYEQQSGIQLSRFEAEVLTASGAVTVSPDSATSDRWQVKAASKVGIVRVGDLDLRVHPKLPISRLLFLISYAMESARWRELTASFGEDRDLLAAVAHAFAFHTEAALAQGVLQGYQQRDDSLPVVRGRIRMDDQLRKRFGFPVPVEVSFDDFTVDITENQLIRSATRALLQLQGVSPKVRRRLVRIDTKLDRVDVLKPGSRLPETPIDRRNRRYSDALDLSRLILRSTSLRFNRGKRPGTSFLIDLNRVFERFMTLALAKEFAHFGGTLESQLPTYLDSANQIGLVPDLVWKHNGRVELVADIKYKSLATKSLPNADLYQVLAYSIALGLSEAHLLYAEGEEPATHNIQGVGKRLRVHMVDLTLPPDAVLDGIRDLAEELSRASEVAAFSAAAMARHPGYRLAKGQPM